MCTYEFDATCVDNKNANSEDDAGRSAVDSLIDFAIECVMEIHDTTTGERIANVKRSLCREII